MTRLCAQVVVLASALLVACGAPAARQEAAASVQVVKSLGGRQCEPGGMTLDALAAQLAGAGVMVQRRACGSDGRMRPAVCGAPDGRIGLFTIPAAQQAQAASLQFAPRATLPDAQEAACR